MVVTLIKNMDNLVGGKCYISLIVCFQGHEVDITFRAR